MMKSLCLYLAAFFFAHTSFAQTISATDDAFDVSMDSVLTIESPGLLDNDDPVTTDSFFVVLVDPTTNGTLNLNTNGSFTYQPDAGFSGTDSFTYLLETVPGQMLEIDSTQSSIDIEMTVNILLSSQVQSASGRVSGGTAFTLTPYDAPFSTAQITQFDATIIDSLVLDYDFGGGNIINATADTNAFSLSILEPGPLATIMDGSFEQTDNLANLLGEATVIAGGLFETLLGDALPDSILAFDVENTISIFATLAQQDDSLTLDTSFSLQDTLLLDEGGLASVNLDVTGAVIANGPIMRPAQSNIATVTITVDPTTNTSVDEELPFEYMLSQNYPNPFNPTTSIVFSIPSTDHVTLKVYDTLGRSVRTLVDGTMSLGQHEVQFEAGDLPSGMYLYRLESGDFSASRTLMLIK